MYPTTLFATNENEKKKAINVVTDGFYLLIDVSLTQSTTQQQRLAQHHTWVGDSLSPTSAEFLSRREHRNQPSQR